MKTIIILSINSCWLQKILNKDKEYEVRKSVPSIVGKLLNGICENEVEVHLYCTNAAPYLFYENESDERFIDTKPYQLAKIKNRYLEEDDAYFNGKIIGKFVLKKIEKIKYIGSERYATDNLGNASLRYKTCLSIEEMHSYLKESTGYAWHIDELEVFDEPKLLIDYNITRAPQSYCYATI